MSLATQLARFTDAGITVTKATSLSKRVQDGSFPGIHAALKFEASLVGEWQLVHANVILFDSSASATGPVALNQIIARGNARPLVVAGCGTHAQFRAVYAADGGTDAVINVIGLDPNGELQLLRNRSGSLDCTLLRATTDLRDDSTTPTEYYTSPDDGQTFDLAGSMAIVVGVKTIASEVGTVEAKIL